MIVDYHSVTNTIIIISFIHIHTIIFIIIQRHYVPGSIIPDIGHRISREGLRQDPAKQAQLKDWPVPKFRRHSPAVSRFC